VRVNHSGRGYEASVSFYNGRNHLPSFEAWIGREAAIIYSGFIPSLRLYGADAAVPLPWFTVKAEGCLLHIP
jgi:hypothetical protein